MSYKELRIVEKITIQTKSMHLYYKDDFKLKVLVKPFSFVFDSCLLSFPSPSPRFPLPSLPPPLAPPSTHASPPPPLPSPLCVPWAVANACQGQADSTVDIMASTVTVPFSKSEQ